MIFIFVLFKIVVFFDGPKFRDVLLGASDPDPELLELLEFGVLVHLLQNHAFFHLKQIFVKNALFEPLALFRLAQYFLPNLLAQRSHAVVIQRIDIFQIS